MWVSPSRRFQQAKRSIDCRRLSLLRLELPFELSSSQGICVLFFQSSSRPPHKNRHFDRSGSRICEPRSGEIRFSTSASTKPTPRFCSCLLLSSRRDLLFSFAFSAQKSHVKPLTPSQTHKTQQPRTFRTLFRLANCLVQPRIIEIGGICKTPWLPSREVRGEPT